jgi:hypothetical protein
LSTVQGGLFFIEHHFIMMEKGKVNWGNPLMGFIYLEKSTTGSLSHDILKLLARDS